jgi:GNAT superfamily N-acetyltransferase
MTVRGMQESDVDEVVGLVHELRAYVRASEQCRLTAVQLRAALCGQQPALFGHVAEVDGEVVGFALWFLNFSTWDGVRGIYLEDLFVRPEHRGTGLGRQLLGALAAECVRRGCSRLQWWCLTGTNRRCASTAVSARNIHVVGQMTGSSARREAVSEACQGRREVVLGRRVVLI